MTCHDSQLALGAFAIGTLDAADRADVEAHLAGCPDCREELSDFLALKPLLATLSVGDVEHLDVPPDPQLFDQLRRRVSDSESADIERGEPREVKGSILSPGRRRRLVAVAAAVVLLAGVIGLVARSVGGGGSSYSAADGPITMTVALHGQTQGTGLSVKVSGLPEDEHCRLVAVSRSGITDLASSWTATYDGTATVSGSTRIARSALDHFVLYGTNGEQLVTVAV